MIQLKRAYEPASRDDGYRVLVERLWPRGVRKEELPLASWEKEVAPSHELRRWFGHAPEKWQEFRQRYRAELKEPTAAERLHALASLAREKTLTLVFSSRDAEHNNAVVLKEELERLVHRGAAKAAHHSPSP